MKAYVINLDRSPDRLAHMQRQFDEIGAAFERFPAVDGTALGEDERAAFAQAHGGSASDWLPGEIGVYLSHFGIWKRIAEGPERAAAIFEDDIYLAADLAPLLHDDSWIPQDADVVRLEASRRMRLVQGARIPQAPKRHLYSIGAASGCWGAAGYVLSKAAATRLIHSEPSGHCAVDLLLFKPSRSAIAASLRRYQVLPALCIQSQLLADSKNLFPSMIGIEGRKPPALAQPSLFERLVPWKKRSVPFSA